jgi:crossover junction endodeoxyribonuclease RusA
MSRASVELTLPYPISANRYWRTASRGARAITYVSAEAKVYREAVALICAQTYGVMRPITGPLAMILRLYGPRPMDWQRRLKRDGERWWHDARCIDLGNAEKVLADALQGLVLEDDKQIVEIHMRRMPPDEKGARVEIEVSPA